MAISHAAPAAASLPQHPPVRRIAPADLKFALTAGWRDFTSMRGDLLFAGLIYPIVGLVAASVSLGGALIPLFFPIAAGIALLGPLTAIGFYELARRREQGLDYGWSHFFDMRKRRAFADMLGVGAILIGLFALWVAAAGGLFLAFWGPNPPPSLGAFLTYWRSASSLCRCWSTATAAWGVRCAPRSLPSAPMSARWCAGA
jgi:uncharacterized membrane protein